MMPSTGPKYSVRWNYEPAAHPVRTPGHQSCPLPSSPAARRQLSPASRVVSAAEQLALGGLDDRAHLLAGSAGSRPAAR